MKKQTAGSHRVSRLLKIDEDENRFVFVDSIRPG